MTSLTLVFCARFSTKSARSEDSDESVNSNSRNREHISGSRNNSAQR